MAFRVKKAKMLQLCTDQVESFITMARFRNTVWTDEKLHWELTHIGLDYTLEEVQRMNDELHTRGIVEDVAEG